MTMPNKRKYERRTPEERIAELELRIEGLRLRTPGGGKFAPKKILAERERLELSAADYAALIGVSQLTVYNWEKGKTTPRTAQVERWLEVVGLSREEAWERLGIQSDFDPGEVLAERERLELSAADYGELVGVSQLTIYNWEKGRTRPRSRQLDRWRAVRGMAKRQAWKQLGFA